MKIIEIKSNEFGGHDNEKIMGVDPSTFPIPEGWAIIPDDMVCENFPFGEITVDESEPPVVTSWTPSEIPEPVVDNSAKIAELKAELEATDYKVIKCSEAQLVGKELPYDIVELHSIRQAIRDQINTLEGGAE